MSRVRRILGKAQRQYAAMGWSWLWFERGYFAALEDIDRTGLHPRSAKARRESADRALKRWVDGETVPE